MKNFKRILTFFIFILIVGCAKLSAQEITTEFFFEKLAPYGHWAEMDELGWVWQPETLPSDWRPYSDGYWVNTTEGWSFCSNTAWAWAVYHYGRWSYQDNYGWVWVPGTVWGPAWVAWRKGDKFVGWAALPPQATWDKTSGLQTSQVNWDTDIHWLSWCFVEPQYFADKEVYKHIQLSSNNQGILSETSNSTNYTIENTHVVNNSLPVSVVQKSTNTVIPVYNIVEVNTYQQNVSQPTNNQIYIYRPFIVQNVVVRPPVNYVNNQYWANRDRILRQEERERRRSNRRMEWQYNQQQRQQNQNQWNNNRPQNNNFGDKTNRENRRNNNQNNTNVNTNPVQTNTNPIPGNNFLDRINRENKQNNNQTNPGNQNPVRNNNNNDEILRKRNEQIQANREQRREKIKEAIQERRAHNDGNKKIPNPNQNPPKDKDNKKENKDKDKH